MEKALRCQPAALIAEYYSRLVNTPRRERLQSNDIEVAQSLAEVHGELILVHPFRDGNGRLARLLALLMEIQAGLPPLDFSPLLGRGKQSYIAGIHAALSRDYTMLTNSFSRVIARSRRRAASNEQ